jgi:hypothetical protein
MASLKDTKLKWKSLLPIVAIVLCTMTVWHKMQKSVLARVLLVDAECRLRQLTVELRGEDQRGNRPHSYSDD